MKLATGIGYSGASMRIDMDFVHEVERLGYDSIWTAEAYGSDAVTPLAYIAALTTRIKLGTSIMQIPGRTPAMCAMTMSTLDAISGGRALVGLGLSGPQVVEGWHGVPYGKPAARTREYVEILRKIWARGNQLSGRQPTPSSGRSTRTSIWSKRPVRYTSPRLAAATRSGTTARTPQRLRSVTGCTAVSASAASH